MKTNDIMVNVDKIFIPFDTISGIDSKCPNDWLNLAAIDDDDDDDDDDDEFVNNEYTDDDDDCGGCEIVIIVKHESPFWPPNFIE
ncbi:hypothetical protein DERF_010782 [Dermatophagoides farinae]|uniref:Uncharacterized protein n=1 Tax=Dermatophagoides farinae TaxID=6954 RepID=A0A922HQZ4_DERFA|nr:hypothetical protein DERF_010782 [Dermatophagoides farinae]